MSNGTNGSSVARTNGVTTVGTVKESLLEVVRHSPAILTSTADSPHIGKISIIELNRPKAMNAISRQLLHELDRELDHIHSKASRSEVRAVIIASTHDKVFCAGADLKERVKMTTDETRHFLSDLRRVFAKLAALPVPSIACVSGLALGGGLELALCCHLRVFSGHAIVGLPETQLAIIPGAGGTYRLPRIVGQSHALDMILTGRRVAATEAAQMGLCNRLVSSCSPGKGGCCAASATDYGAVRQLTLAAALSLARDISTGGPVAIRAAVSALAVRNEDAENAAYDSVLKTRDRIEALHAFQAKVSPKYLGI